MKTPARRTIRGTQEDSVFASLGPFSVGSHSCTCAARPEGHEAFVRAQTATEAQNNDAPSWTDWLYSHDFKKIWTVSLRITEIWLQNFFKRMTGLQLSGKFVLEELATGEILAQQKQLWIMEDSKPRLLFPSAPVLRGTLVLPESGGTCQDGGSARARTGLPTMLCSLFHALPFQTECNYCYTRYQEKHSLHIKYRINLRKISMISNHTFWKQPSVLC